MLVVHPAVPVKTVKDLIALAKAKPRDIDYGSSGTGTGTHLSAELFKYMTGVDMVHVPYKGGGPAVQALLGGQVQLNFATTYRCSLMCAVENCAPSRSLQRSAHRARPTCRLSRNRAFPVTITGPGMDS
jgi:tripartite-type tricarboxylate transporter receptor subunit TctC